MKHQVFDINDENIPRNFKRIRESSFNMTRGGGMKILKLEA